MFSVIMAGGSGTRFWPLSRQRAPKQFLSITGKNPMVVETCDRLKPLSRDEEMILVMGAGHLDQARALFGRRSIRMLGEPQGRNTAPAIGLGAVYARHLGSRGPVAFLPADHYIGAPSSFVEALRAAGRMAAAGGGIVTLGIVPVRPETGYGYIRRGEASGAEGAYRVLEFVEKPDMEKARRYLACGDYYWNAGIFVATPETILAETEKLLPELHEALLRMEKALDTSEFEDVFRQAYESIEAVSFDYGIMEKTKEAVYVVPCECAWSDVGSWESLYELREEDRDGNRNLTEGNALLVDSEGNFVSARAGRFVACLGLSDCLVIDTPEILLVTPMDRSQDIRKIVDRLKAGKQDHLL